MATKLTSELTSDQRDELLKGLQSALAPTAIEVVADYDVVRLAFLIGVRSGDRQTDKIRVLAKQALDERNEAIDQVHRLTALLNGREKALLQIAKGKSDAATFARKELVMDWDVDPESEGANE